MNPEHLPLLGNKYRITGKIGEGQTSVVYEAVHEPLGNVVVVKALREELASDPQIAARFRLEGRTLGQLHHANIVRVIDLHDAEDGGPFLVLERLWGHTLAEELRRRGPFAIDEALPVIIELLDALQDVHALGIVHRDLNLNNIFLHESGGGTTLKLLDFGHAKVLIGLAPNTPAPIAIPTPEDALLGTPRTMSPEHVEHRALDPRADIYSVGVLLYWLVTGRDPFNDATTTEEVFTAHVMRLPDPPSSWALESIPEELDALVLRALAKDPSDRFQTVEDFRAALTSLAGTEQEPRHTATEQQEPEQASELDGHQNPAAASSWIATSRGAAVFVVLVAAGVLLLLITLFPGVIPGGQFAK